MLGDHPNYAIIGGGISGLASAYYLRKHLPLAAITVFESSPRLGGVLRTVRRGNFLVETSADMFVTQPSAALELWREIGVEASLLQTRPVKERAYIGMGKAIHPVPQGLSMMVPTLTQPILDCDLLSEEGKQRYLAENEIPASNKFADESLKSFAVRRFGVEAYEKIIQPMVSGIYTADPDKLSMQATMQRFVNMERHHGNLIGAMQREPGSDDRQASGARYGLFRAPQNGMESMVRSLIGATPNVEFKTNQGATKVMPKGKRWSVDGQSFSGIVMATPAVVTSAMVADVDPLLAHALSGITTASSAIVALGIDRNSIRRGFEGFGIIYPHIDAGQVIALSFSSNKFSGRCDDDSLLIRCFIGGALQSELVDLDNNALIDLATKQLDRSVGFSGETLFADVFRWKNCMPQYHLGHLDRVTQIEQQVATHRGLEIAGNSYWGVGIPACIASGKSAADRIVADQSTSD